MLSICFFSGNLEFWYFLDWGCLCDQSPTKALGTGSILSRQHITCVITAHCQGNYGTHLGEVTWKLTAWFPPDFGPCAFFFFFFCLHWFCFISSAVIGHSLEFDYVLNPMCPSKLSYLGLVDPQYSQHQKWGSLEWPWFTELWLLDCVREERMKQGGLANLLLLGGCGVICDVK